MISPRQLYRAVEWRFLALLRRRLRGGQALIMMYHRIAEPENDVWDICVSPTKFREHLEVLRRRGPILAMPNFMRHWAEGSLPCGASAITFDDGYRDNLLAALPALEEAEAPATVFVVSSNAQNGQPFWWDRLTACLGIKPVMPKGFELSAPSAPAPWIGDGEICKNPHLSLWAWLAALDPTDRETQLTKIEQRFGSLGATRLTQVMRPEEIARLAAHPLIEIGGHTASHPHLSWLPLDRQQQEIVSGKTTLENWIGKPVTGFSYPFGNHGPETEELLPSLGLDYATTNVSHIVTKHSRRYAMPRVRAINNSGDSLLKTFRWIAG